MLPRPGDFVQLRDDMASLMGGPLLGLVTGDSTFVSYSAAESYWYNFVLVHLPTGEARILWLDSESCEILMRRSN